MTTRTPASRFLWMALVCGIFSLALATVTSCGGRPEEESGSSGETVEPDPSVYAGTYSGTFSGSDSGDFEITVDTSGTVTGNGTSVADGAITFTGSVDGSGNLSATSSNGAVWDGLIDDGSGSVSGSWTNDPDSGTFSGSAV